jgi:membrane protein implicated in regulation of membrane protease activity
LVDNELWRAEIIPGKAPLEAGKKVKVREVNGLTLIVEPAGDDA